MKLLILCAWSFLLGVAGEGCAVPAAFPKSSTVTRSFWSPHAKVDFSPMTFEHTTGYCRSGKSWPHQPALKTNAGLTHGAPNNAFGNHLWFCFEEARTQIGCMAECEARYFCGSLDRGILPGKQECCLFYEGNTGDGVTDRECFVRKQLPEDALPATALRATSVSVWPVPILTYLKLTSHTTGVNADSEQGFCPFWTWCGWTVKDCFGNLLYVVEAQMMPDMDSDGNEMRGTSVIAYQVKSGDGHYLGRTAKLSDGSDPIHIFNKDNQLVATMITREGWIMRSFFDMRWYIDVANPDTPVEEEPMTDPRLLTFMATYQFRGLGYFGGFLSILLILLFMSVCGYFIYLRFCTKYGSYGSMRFRECFPCCFPKREFLVNYDEEQYGGGCCTGRSKQKAWRTDINALKPIE